MIGPEHSIAVVGATGVVGLEALSILATRGCRPDRVRALASERSVGTILPFGDGTTTCELAEPGRFAGTDVALFCASADVAQSLAPEARAAGAFVVDNSSAFRLSPGVPLIVPEVSCVLPELAPPRLGRGDLAANPNCSTILLLVALGPLLAEAPVERCVVSTYQAASGAGIDAMRELEGATGAALKGESYEQRVFTEPYAFNCFSHDSAVDTSTGAIVEEQKMADECAKILGSRAFPLHATCVRVPVLRAHTESVWVLFKRPVTEPSLRARLAQAPGVRIIDDRARNSFPTPAKASGRDEVLVGRLRPDCSTGDDNRGYTAWSLMLAGDQIRKGAALNAIQIADHAVL